MSWSYSRALVAEYLGECSSDIDPSALSSTTHTPDLFYWPDKTTEHSRLSRFGMTCEPLTGSLGGELLMWFLEDSLVKIYQSPEPGPDWTAKGQGYGEKWLGLLGRYDPDTHSLRTAQCSLFEGLIESSPTLPTWGLMLVGELYPQPIPALGTEEIVSGYWPTPTVCGNYNRPGASATSGMGLASAVRMYSTPCADDTGYRKEKYAQGGAALSMQAGGPLNPGWVEWLMGWPIGQTELKPLETGRFREFMQQHSIC